MEVYKRSLIMIKKLFIFLMLLLYSSLCNASIVKVLTEWQTKSTWSKNGVCTVRTFNGHYTGTSIYVFDSNGDNNNDSSLILTAGHIESSSTINRQNVKIFVVIEKIKYPAKLIVRVEKDNIDFSLLTIRLLTSTTDIADRNLKVNEPTITRCFDKGSFKAVSKKGKISANINYVTAIRWTVLGNSGAPIGLYEDTPKVYGVLRGYSARPNERQFTYFTPISIIRPYIIKFINDTEYVPPPPVEKPIKPKVKEKIKNKVNPIIINGKDGRDGKDGANGKDGLVGLQGLPGKDGKDLVLSSEDIQKELLNLIKSGQLDGYKGTIRINVKSKVITKE